MNYSAVKEKARKAISKNGSTCTVVHVVSETYSKTTNKYEKITETIAGVALVNNYDEKYIDGENVKVGDVNIMAVLDSSPSIGDSITVGARTWNTVNVVPFMPDGKTVIYYTIQGR